MPSGIWPTLAMPRAISPTWTRSTTRKNRITMKRKMKATRTF